MPVVLLAESFDALVDAAIAEAKLPKGDISIVIADTRSGTLRYTLHAQQTRVPASVMKLATLYATARTFGFDYRIPTKLYIDGRVQNGVLQGNLIVKGYGDPSLSTEDLNDFTAAVRHTGITRITGNLVIDRSFLKVSIQNSSHFDRYLYSPYNAMPDAMMFNERVSRIVIDAPKQRIYKELPDRSFDLVNRVRFVQGACRGMKAYPQIAIRKEGARNRVIVAGTLSVSCPKRTVEKVLTRPYLSFYYAFKAALKQGGITLQGNLRFGKVAPGAKRILIHRSAPLRKLIAHTAKKSDNLYARQLFLYLGARTFGAPGTLAKAREAVRSLLENDGILQKGEVFKIDNGSGLSRNARLNAMQLYRLLQQAYRRYGSAWMQTLSIAGIDGTIHRRFRYAPAHGKAWMKTGTLNRVKNIAGYVADANGRLYTVVILVNSRAGNWRASQLQNRIINTIASHRF